MSRIYLEVRHGFLDPTPKLVKKFAIIALGGVLHDVVHQVKQHQLLLYPHLETDVGCQDSRQR